ncbi:MAG: SAM-dependent methyltransferase [Candidatus Moranbacteria bacterium]|jgi:ribosomal protein L11 methylase PrmA|nr:SAM-dependent methyltransferase [Candidatus Moranbacteria bacterium]
MNKSSLGSFRDPSGFVFEQDGKIYRQVNDQYKNDYDLLMGSGLYKNLEEKKLLISHKEEDLNLSSTNDAYKILLPKRVPFISYPYEWSFSQLKDAALTTLKIQKIALENDMSLKDASAYNIQFVEGRPMLIDTLSFEKYIEGKPWVAYKQFCQHFLAPLALMVHKDVRLNLMSKLFIDGIPLDIASKLLPLKTRLKLGILFHIHLHAFAQKKYADKQLNKNNAGKNMDKKSLLALLTSLEDAVQGLSWEPKGTEWADYYSSNNNYVSESLKHKSELVEEFIDLVKSRNVWDFGGNNGLFSRIASNKNIDTISLDIDPSAVEMNYRTVRKMNEKNILPLVMDLTNPSPKLGWDNDERDSFLNRCKADTGLVLALVHHLAISNNVPLSELARFFSSLCNSLIIEFIPKEDSQVKKLLATREDIFSDYNKEGFERAFKGYFEIKKISPIKDSKRTLYLMKKL